MSFSLRLIQVNLSFDRLDCSCAQKVSKVICSWCSWVQDFFLNITVCWDFIVYLRHLSQDRHDRDAGHKGGSHHPVKQAEPDRTHWKSWSGTCCPCEEMDWAPDGNSMPWQLSWESCLTGLMHWGLHQRNGHDFKSVFGNELGKNSLAEHPLYRIVDDTKLEKRIQKVGLLCKGA